MRIDQIKIDEWYDIPGYGGKYQINYYGNIRRALKNGRYKEIHPFIKKSNGFWISLRMSRISWWQPQRHPRTGTKN